MLLLLALLLGSCRKAEPAEQAGAGPEPAADKVAEESPFDPDIGQLAQRLAQQFGTDEATVLRLREEGVGWGQVEMTLAIARRAGLEPDEIARRRAEGKRWSEIPRELGFELADVIEDEKALEVLRDEEVPISELLARYYEVGEETLFDLRHRGMDWGEIQVSLEVARRSGSSLAEITDRYFAGEGLGDITKSFGFTPAQILKASENPFKRDDEAFVKTTTPDPGDNDG